MVFKNKNPKTKVNYNKTQSQKNVEKETIINELKNLVAPSSTGRRRGIKLPEYINFNLKDSNLHLYIMEFSCEKDGIRGFKNTTCENMQSDNAAFEGWAISLKTWLPDKIKDVYFEWDIPSTSSQNGHYNRFLYRVWRFEEAYSWFHIAEKKELKDAISNFSKEFCCITNNSYSKKPDEKKKPGGFGETEMEYLLANDLANTITEYYSLSFIDRQFPVGLKQKGKQFFTGGMSAIDLWGFKDKKITIIELKYNSGKSKNIKVGIISELFLYCCVMRDIARGVVGRPTTASPKETEKKLYDNAQSFNAIKGEMLSDEYHPLVSKETLTLLNDNNFNNDIPIAFGMTLYSYKDKQLEIPKKS